MPPRLATSTDKPAIDTYAGNMRLREALAMMCDDPYEPLDEGLLKPTFDWQPLFNKEDLMTALDNMRNDANGTNLACTLMLASLSVEQMREYVSQGDVERVAEMLECVAEFYSRVRALKDATGCAFARLFSASNEAFGGGAPAKLKLVEA